MFVYPNIIFPLVASYNLQTKFAMVDFPLPVLPKIPNVFPFFNSKTNII